ncbi:hypothetical protein M9Y10_012341 [Tritrichomonas musculus]|uniref:Protein kinase domain-containing protein n=1 Tax=Tritrichomonas musculus TaxID=1915356 RepID=A0ABR2ICD5_9EUKA
MSQIDRYIDIQNIDDDLLRSVFPSIDIDDLTKFKKSFTYQAHRIFFQQYQQHNKKNPKYISKIQIKEIESANDSSHKYNLLFDLNEMSFMINHQNFKSKDAEREKEIFLRTKSNFILHSQMFQSDPEAFLPYLIGSTIEEIINQNQESHIITDADKILWVIEISSAMSDLYNENSDSNNYNFYHGNISDQSFFIDSMKNAYLFSISENKRHNYFHIKNDQHIHQQTNISFLQQKKIDDLNSIGILIAEIFEEKTPEKEYFTNSSIQFYRNHHSEIDKILNNFPYRKGTYTEFKNIISDIQNTTIYKAHQHEIEKRLEKAKSISPSIKSSFHTLIFSKLVGVYDIKPICVQLFTQLRDQNEKGSDYYLFFNLILHIFFPDVNQNLRKIDYIELLNLFNTANDLTTNISTLLNEYLLIENEYHKILYQLKVEKIINDKAISQFSNIEILIRNEIGGKANDQAFLQFLQKIMHFYFPYEKTKNNNIFDYFGIIYFLKNKENVVRIAHPTMSEKNINRLNSLSNNEQIENFIKKSIIQKSNICVLDFIREFDSSLIRHKLLFNVSDSSFYLNRIFFFGGDVNDFRKKVRYQDDLFTKINSKYILHLDSEANNMKHDAKSSSSDFSFIPTTLLHVIQRNSHNRIINDCDKILWAIQIAIALRDLQEYLNRNHQEHQTDFKDCIYDQSFYIDSMKNIYLGTLAYPSERENENSCSDGPIYFRSFKNPSYIYTYGVLLNEIITEIEPKNLFGKDSRSVRVEKLKKGYFQNEEFEKTGQKWYELYGNDLKDIVNSCLKNEINEFDTILNLLRETKLYNNWKFIIEKREKEANPLDSSRRCTFKSLLISEISGIANINNIFINLFERLDENSNDKYQNFYNKILKELKHNYSPVNYFQAIVQISEASQSE